MRSPINEILRGKIVLNLAVPHRKAGAKPVRESVSIFLKRTRLCFERLVLGVTQRALPERVSIRANIMLNISDACLIVSDCLAAGVVAAVAL